MIDGASSSTAEHRTVDARAVGSKPIWHPKEMADKVCLPLLFKIKLKMIFIARPY